VACIAVTLASFMPMVSHAVQAQRAAEILLHEICTANGLRTVDIAAANDHAGTPEKHQGHANDCPYCRLQADHPALPPLPHDVPIAGQIHASHPLLFYRSPYRLFTWVSANPRAPPYFS
jgi:hypothetical protein